MWRHLRRCRTLLEEWLPFVARNAAAHDKLVVGAVIANFSELIAEPGAEAT